MPDYTKLLIVGCRVYFTSACLVEAFHAHAGKTRSPKTAAKFFIRNDGSVFVQSTGTLDSREIRAIAAYIHTNYRDMYESWVAAGGTPQFYNKR